MKSIRILMAAAVIALGYHGTVSAQTAFEGTLTTRVTVAGVDMSQVTEAIDYGKGNIQEQMEAAYRQLPAADLSRLQTVMTENPMMGLVVAMTPPKATVYVKGQTALAHIRGLGYEIIHAHNEQKDEAFIYTASLMPSGDAVTAGYQPSQGYEGAFAEDKRITADQFDMARSAGTADVAGHSCTITTYTPKAGTTEPAGFNAPLHKLVVYSSKDLPKGINFSHPYYLPEESGILRIDIYLDDTTEPSMVYEVTDIDESPVDDSLLTPRKTEPVYTLSDSDYGMRVLGILLGGLGAMGDGD